jgi:SAM-dependent methyltransferase
LFIKRIFSTGLIDNFTQFDRKQNFKLDLSDNNRWRSYRNGILNHPTVRKAELEAICSLAAFHHFDNRVAKTGQHGRKDFLKEALKLLKPGGRLILVDVGGNTPTQRYFDAIDSPKFFAPSGHPHDFHTPDELTELATEVGFAQAQAQIKDTPWVFDSLTQAKTFIHSIHNAQCSEDESFAIANKMLGMAAKNSHLEFNWQLMFFSAIKK